MQSLALALAVVGLSACSGDDSDADAGSDAGGAGIDAGTDSGHATDSGVDGGHDAGPTACSAHTTERCRITPGMMSGTCVPR